MSEPKKKILLLEDNRDCRDFYKDLLSKEYEVTTANDGEEGLNKLLSPDNYDLLVLDIMMPKLDGVDLLKAKNKDQKAAKVPVVVLSNLGHEDVLKACFEQGIKFYILKAETNPDQFLAVVKKALTA